MASDGLGPLHAEGEMPQEQLTRVLRTRAVRGKFFDPELFADPAWDILLALYEAKLTQRRISVSSCCFAAQVPTTTGLRYIAALCRQGMVLRTPDPLDARRMFLSLSREGSAAMQLILQN
jgi:DNA-binding MarR family transcriptional regulator